MFTHTFLRNRNESRAPFAYIADVVSPPTLWPTPTPAATAEPPHDGVVELEESVLNEPLVTPSQEELHAAKKKEKELERLQAAAPPGWRVWIPPHNTNNSNNNIANKVNVDHLHPQKQKKQKKQSRHQESLMMRASLREYMQLPTMPASVAFVHGGADALCARLVSDRRCPDMVFIDGRPSVDGATKTKTQLRRDYDTVVDQIAPRILAIGGCDDDNGGAGAELWADVVAENAKQTDVMVRRYGSIGVVVMQPSIV